MYVGKRRPQWRIRRSGSSKARPEASSGDWISKTDAKTADGQAARRENQLRSSRITKAGKPAGSVLIKLPFHQRFDFHDRLGGIVTLGEDEQFAARASRQHHQAHDALAVDLLTVLLDEDIALEAVGRLDEHGGGPGMDSEFVDHDHFLGDFHIVCFSGAAHFTRD